jgi:biotin operon repressor
MGDAITKASTRVLEQALGEPASDEALADVLGEAFVRDATGGEWAAALLRGAQVQRELLQQAGGGLSASQVGDLLGISRAAVDKRRRQGSLLGLKLPSGDFVYPAAQFVKNDVVRGLSDVLSAFHVEDPWMQLDALLARDEALGGRTAFEALAQGDVERVKLAVSSFGEQGL